MTRVILLGLDGFSTRAIAPDLTPNLWGLAHQGGWAPDGGRAALPSSTYPGFGSLLTGVPPDRHGVRATAMKPGAIPGWAGELRVETPTLFDRCQAAGARSAAVQGDHLLHAVLGTYAADRIWPRNGVPGEGVPRDSHGYPTNEAVRPELLGAVADSSFDFVFGHLNETDTFGHDLGPDHHLTRECYRATDHIIGEVVTALANDWDDAVLMIVSDHDMEARTDFAPIDLYRASAVAPYVADVLPDGGAAWVKLRQDADPLNLREALNQVCGIESCIDDAEERMLVVARPGWVFASPSLPNGGYHGGSATIRTVAIVAGGHPAVTAIGAAIAERPPRLIDWAPTICDLLGLSRDGMQGVSLGSATLAGT